jgi:hypothetical protein
VEQIAIRAVETSRNENRSQIIFAMPCTASTVPLMHWNWKWFRATVLVVLLVLNAGLAVIVTATTNPSAAAKRLHAAKGIALWQ